LKEPLPVIPAPPWPLELGPLDQVGSSAAPVPPVRLVLLQPASSPATTIARKILLSMITTFLNSIGQCSLTGREAPNGDCSSYRVRPGPICRFRRSPRAPPRSAVRNRATASPAGTNPSYARFLCSRNDSLGHESSRATNWAAIRFSAPTG
jgi:hypothetical protein